jgi:hypothetical protein
MASNIIRPSHPAPPAPAQELQERSNPLGNPPGQVTSLRKPKRRALHRSANKSRGSPTRIGRLGGVRRVHRRRPGSGLKPSWESQLSGWEHRDLRRWPGPVHDWLSPIGLRSLGSGGELLYPVLVGARRVREVRTAASHPAHAYQEAWLVLRSLLSDVFTCQETVRQGRLERD